MAPPGHAFSCSDVERHPCPSPGLDGKPGGDERFSGGVVAYAWFVEVTDVLSADGVRRVERFYLPEDLEFLVSVGVGVIGYRRLHSQ